VNPRLVDDGFLGCLEVNMGRYLLAEKSAYLVAVGLVLVLGVGCAASDEVTPRDAPVGRSGVMGPGGVAGAAGGMVAPGAGGSGAPAPDIMVVTPVGSTPIPCNVQNAVQPTCGNCHGASPIGGAPMKLVTHEDWTNPAYVVKTTKESLGMMVKMHELALTRLNSTSAPMPPGMAIKPEQKATIDAWLKAGAVAGTDADRTCVITPAVVVPGEKPAGMVYSMEPLVARPELGEICYDLLSHGGQTLGDTTKYTVKTGENYEQFYYNVPWKAGEVGARFGAKFDNIKVLHHWLLFTTGLARTPGSHETVIGTQLGDPNAQLIGGWAIGGSSVTFPEDVGLKLPPPGTLLNVQWHLYNSTGAPAPDGSAVQVCTVPAASRAHLAGMTWLGTENFNGPFGMGPGMQKFGGTCTNDSGADITILTFWPHMHRIGRHMDSVVGGKPVFGEVFDPNRQIHYDQTPALVLKPNEQITSTCTFDNGTGKNVAFGPSTDQEMCYQFAFSYPAGALDNGVISLIGATNTCW
jgi:hypothetical protein